MLIILTLLSLLAGLNIAFAGSNPPEFKAVFDYQVLELIKTDFLEPLIQLEGKSLKVDKTITLQKDFITVALGNLTLSNLTLDWDNTHLLTPGEGNLTSIQIQNLCMDLEFDTILTLWKDEIKSLKNNVSIQGFSIDITIGFGIDDDETSYAYFDSVNVGLKDLKLQFGEKIANILAKFIDRLPFEKLLAKAVGDVILGFNKTLIEATTKGLSVVLLEMLKVHVALADLPFIFNVRHDAYQSISVNVDISNVLTNETAPVASANVMPDYNPDFLPLQLFVSETLIAQLLWAVFQTGKVDLIFSEKNIAGLGLPLHLNTTDLNILFPNVTLEYGPGKGVYAEIVKGGDYPMAFIREGRLVIELSILLNLFVDVDSEFYPDQGLKNCTTCDLAVSLNLTAFVALDIFKVSPSRVGAKIMDIVVVDIVALYGEVDEDNLQYTLNNLFVPLMVQFDQQLSQGIANPLIGLFGINDTTITLGSDYLYVGLSIENFAHNM